MVVIDFIKNLIATNAARTVAYGGTLALAGAAWAAKYFGVELTPELTTAVQAIGVFVATELIRRFVWSKESVETIKAGG